MKYELKTQTVTATQWFAQGDHPHVGMLPNKDFGWLASPGGGCAVGPGDWIIEDDSGQVKVMPDYRFKALYKEVE